MILRSKYNKKLFLYFFSVFIVFTVVIIIFQYDREKKYRIHQLENTLDNYTELINSFVRQRSIFRNKNYRLVDSIIKYIPRSDIRITMISQNGAVLFDSFVEDFSAMENHINRPEIQESIYSDFGTSVRKSETTGEQYYYYSKFYEDYFIRTAVIFDIQIQKFLKAERLFLYFIMILFFIVLVSLIYVSDKIGKSISKLKDFAIKAGENKPVNVDIQFPQNELGVIGRQIVQIYTKLKTTSDELNLEREKLIHHLQLSAEGIAIFSPQKKNIIANSRFIQYSNIISDNPSISPDQIFKIKEFKSLNDFIDSYKSRSVDEKHMPGKKQIIEKSRKYFDIGCLIFQDKSFEVSINDVTKPEKQKLLKHQMTTNIAHELRTPITSIKGYLETILVNENLENQKQKYFVEKAYKQIDRLSDLVNDISILTKIEEAHNLYVIEEMKILPLINDVLENLKAKLDNKDIQVNLDVDQKVKIKGNKSLIFSIFQNLVENSINYAGNNVEISVKQYFEDDIFYYFLYSDNGVGIEEEHLPRIFERFYRVDKGRSRKDGGTGLGLAIVKNAILFHKGEISVKPGDKGGVEFLFSISRYLP